MSNADDATRRPRIVQPRPADPSEASSDARMTGAAEKQDDYNFFAFPPAERVEAIKERIKDREKVLFDLQCNVAMLDGNPSPGVHESEASRVSGSPSGGTIVRPCNCGDCELGRLRDGIAGLEFALIRLRALHSRMMN